MTEVFYPTGELKSASGSQTYPVSYTYDYAGRLLSQTTWQNKTADTGAVITAWEYYPNGLLKQKWYDATIAGDGTISGTAGPSYTYTKSGRLKTQTNSRGTLATYTYNSNTLDLTSIIYNDTITPSVSYSNYDRQGRMQQITDASGVREIDYENGQLTDESYISGALLGYTIDREQDVLNRLDSLVLEQGIDELYRVDYGYDSASRLQTVAQGNHTVSYTYDPSSELRESRTFNNGTTNMLTAEHRYDHLNRLKQITTLNSSFLILNSHAYQYNDLNQRERMTVANGDYWQYTYDSLGQVENAVYKDASDTVFPGRSFGFIFDDIGNRTRTNTNARIANYPLNNLNQYERRQIPRALDVSGSAHSDSTVTVNGAATNRKGEYFYRKLDLSAGGNGAQQVDILATATLPDGGDRDAPRIAEVETSEYLPPSPEVFAHDADGNLTQDGKWSYTWNAKNRLVEMETRPFAYNAGASRQKLEFAYDSQGRRFSKKVYDWDPVSRTYLLTASFQYLYDGWNLIFVPSLRQSSILNPESQIQTTKSFVWGLDLSGSQQGAGGVGGLLMVTNAEDLTYYPTFDGNGNVMGYYAANTGASVVEFEYGPFGELIRSTGKKKDDFSFRFSTKYEDAETRLLYYGYRYYNAETVRWLNRDPIEEDGGLNLYVFVDNDSLNYIDDLGHNKKGYTGPIPKDQKSPNPVPTVHRPNHQVPDTKSDVVRSPMNRGQNTIPKGAPLPQGPAGAAGGVANLIGQVQAFNQQLEEINTMKALHEVAVGSPIICDQQRRAMGKPKGCGCCVTIMIVSRQNPATTVRGFFGGRAYLPPSGPITKVYSAHISYIAVHCSETERGGIPGFMFGGGRSEFTVKKPF